ncbi:MAG: methyl-accepting chemotaxis protein, partial [Myxococcaceae bacterium]
MLRRIQKLGLQWAIFGSFTIALLAIFVALIFLIPTQVKETLTVELAKKGNAAAAEVRKRVQDMSGLSEAALGSVLDQSMAAADPSVKMIVLTNDNLEAKAWTSGGPLLPNQVVNEFRDSGRSTRFELSNDDLLVATPNATSSGTNGWILTVLDRKPVLQSLAGLKKIVLVAFLTGFFVLIVLVYVISRVFILQPLDSMMKVARKMSEADLTATVTGATANDQMGRLAQALNQIAQALRDTLSRVRGVSEGVAQVIEQISRTGSTVSNGASTIQQRVEETSSSMMQMMTSLRGIAENVEVLYQSAEESSSSIMEMAATNDEVAENVTAMAASVEETTSAIEQMTFSIKEVAKNIEDLYASSEETSSSMNEMDVSIGQVEMNANETARLSETVSQDAATGVEALSKTLTGIDKIKDSSRTAAGVIETLGKRISDIGNILNVIDDVAEQTNLLALNAAIIAAQAGEHGKGFAVVAEEIKDLAERTGASTKEIADLVRAVQDESKNAVQVMNTGVKNVEEGVRLGREAESALKKIFDSAQKSTQMVKAIARATVEQARGSKQVTSSIHRIAETVQQISKASNEQA